MLTSIRLKQIKPLMKNNNLQNRFFEELLKRFDNQAQAVAALKEILGKGKDSIYKRLRGETELTVNEMDQIADALNINLGKLSGKGKNQYLFSFNHENRFEQVEDYFEDIVKDIESFGDVNEGMVYCASQEIPLFLHFLFPKTLFFKHYLHGYTIWNIPSYKTEKFHLGMISPKFEQICSTLGKHLIELNTIDIWNMGFLDQTINQIEFMAEIEQFKYPQEALELCDCLLIAIDHIKKMAEDGRKFLPGAHKNEYRGGKFELYYNELAVMNDTIISVKGEHKTLYSSLGPPDYLKSSDPGICNIAIGWFNSVMANSTCISGQSRRKRHRYFKRIRNKVEHLKMKLQSSIL